MNNVAQGAAVLAVLFLTKNEKMKSICSASGVSALLGITEPAMFGVTLKLKYPFYAAIIGSAVGNAYCAATGVLAQALGAAGLPHIPVHASKRLLKLRDRTALIHGSIRSFNCSLLEEV